MLYQQRFNKYLQFVTNKPKSILAAFLLLTLFLSLGTLRLSFNNDYRIYFGKDNPQLKDYEHIENIFSRIDAIVFTVFTPDGTLFTKDHLKALKTITDRAWKLPYSTRVDSITNFMHTRTEGDHLYVEELVDDVDSLTDARILKIKQIALTHPQIRDRLLSKDGNFALVVVNTLFDTSKSNKSLELAAIARKLADEIMSQHSGLQVGISGGVMVNASFGEATIRDMRTLIPAMHITIFVLLAIILGSLRGTFYALIVVTFSYLSALGLFGWFNIPLNATTNVAPIIIMTIALADSVHLLKAVTSRAINGTPLSEAMTMGLKKVFVPIFITSLTTALGFVGLSFSTVPPLREFGALATIGVVCAFLASVFLLPALINLFGISTWYKNGQLMTNLFKKMSFIINSYRYGILGIASVVIIASLSLIPTIRIDDSFLEYFDYTFQFRKDAELQQDRLGGLFNLEYSIESNEEGGVFEPAYLAKLEHLETFAKSLQPVTHVNSIVPIIKKIRQRLNADDPQFYSIPKSRTEGAQLFMLYDMSLPFGRDLNNQINISRSATRVIISFSRVSNDTIMATARHINEWLDKHLSPITYRGPSGISMMFANIFYNNTKAMLFSMLFVFVTITLSLILCFRSLRFGLVSLLPNLFPIVTAFGIWALLVGEVGFISSAIGAITLGIIVDDTVHFLTAYLRARKEERLPAAEAVYAALNDVGSALITTSIILVCGFSLLLFSGFFVNKVLGALCLLTIAIALLFDLMVFPALLIVLDKKLTKERNR